MLCGRIPPLKLCNSRLSVVVPEREGGRSASECNCVLCFIICCLGEPSVAQVPTVTELGEWVAASFFSPCWAQEQHPPKLLGPCKSSGSTMVTAASCRSGVSSSSPKESPRPSWLFCCQRIKKNQAVWPKTGFGSGSHPHDPPNLCRVDPPPSSTPFLPSPPSPWIYSPVISAAGAPVVLPCGIEAVCSLALAQCQHNPSLWVSWTCFVACLWHF